MDIRMINPEEREQMIEVLETQLALLQRDGEIVNSEIEEVESRSQELSEKMHVILSTAEHIQNAIHSLSDDRVEEGSPEEGVEDE